VPPGMAQINKMAILKKNSLEISGGNQLLRSCGQGFGLLINEISNQQIG
jgi:hypothetical protein